MDWWMALVGMSVSDEIEVALRRGDEQLALSFPLAKRPFQPAIEVTDAAPGLRYRFFHGRFAKVPAFSQMKPIREGIVNAVDLDQIRADRDEDFGIELSGFVQIPEDDVYRLVVVSDDGSMLYVDGELAVDNDGDHPRQAMSRLLRLEKGLHALRLEYFQGKSGLALELLMGSDAEPQPVSADSLFHSASSVE
jgi:hypothetical protein